MDGGKVAGPLTLMGSWMPSITTWEWTSPALGDVEHNNDGSAPPIPKAQAGKSESCDAEASHYSSSPAGAAPAQQPDSNSGFAMHGLGAKMWKLRRRTIPIKPMTADERDLYEQGKLGVEQFVIEEDDEEDLQSEPIPAPPSLDKIHEAFASTFQESQGLEDHGARATPPLAQAHDLAPCKVSAVFEQLGTPEEPASRPGQARPAEALLMPGSRKAPPSDAEKLDMMRIFAEAEGDGEARGCVQGVGESGGEAAGLDLTEADVTKLSDEELFRQLQVAQQKLVRGALDSSRGADAVMNGSGQVSSAMMAGLSPGEGWRADPELQAELQDAEDRLREQERELAEARARAQQEEEMMRREQMRLQGWSPHGKPFKGSARCGRRPYMPQGAACTRAVPYRSRARTGRHLHGHPLQISVCCCARWRASDGHDARLGAAAGVAAMTEQENKRKRMLAEQHEAQRKTLELETRRMELEQQVVCHEACLKAVPDPSRCRFLSAADSCRLRLTLRAAGLAAAQV